MRVYELVRVCSARTTNAAYGGCIQYLIVYEYIDKRSKRIFLILVFAVLVDKDQSPKWNPSTLEGVSDQYVEQCFSSLGEKDLTF